MGVTVTLTDGDGDQVSSAAADIGTHINFLDDGPSNISPGAVSLLNGSGSATAPLDVDTNTDNNYGADGGTVIFAASLNGQDSGLTSSAQKIFYQTSNGGHTLTGFADKNLNGVYDPATDTTAIFTINLNLDKSLAVATDTYTVQMLGRVDSATHIDFNSGGYNFVGGNNSWAEFIPVGETVANPIDNNSPDLLLTPAVNHLPASSINTSANSGGVGSGQSVGSVGNLPETFRVDFVTDLRGDPAGSPANYGNPANRDHVFDGHYTVDGSSTDFTATSGSTINIAAFDDPDGNNIVGDGVKDKITGVVIRFGGSTSGFIDLTQLTNPSLAVGGHNFTITENADGSIDVGGVAGTTSVATFTADGYNSLEYTWVSGETFKIGNFGAAKLSTAPVDFSVPVQVVDGDGDTAAGSIGVTLTQPPAPTVTITDDEAGTANIASGSILYTFQFSETVTGFDAADITVVNGTPGTFTAVDGDTYTLVVTPMADFQGILTVGVAAGVAFDAAAAPNTAAALSVQAVDTLAPVASITLDAITADNIVNAAEAAGPVAVTGTVGGDVQVGDTVTLMVNGNSSYTGQVQAGLTFSIDVAGSDLAAGTNVHASVNTTDAAGNAATATDDQAYTVDTANPSASVDIAANLLTQTNIESLVTIHFNEAVTGFGPDDLTVVGGATPELLTFQQIDADTYTMKLLVEPNFEGTAQVTLDGAYTDLAGNPGITGASDTVDINTLASTLDATILTTGTSGLGQTVALTFVDLQNPIFSYAGLYDLGAQGGAFQRDAGFNIDPSKEYAVSLEATGEVPVPIRVLTVEGVTIHVIEGTVTLQLDNDNSTILTQTALTSIIAPGGAVLQSETASVDGNALDNNGLFDPQIQPGTGVGSAENTVNYLYGADGRDDLTGNNDTDALNGGAGNDTLSGGDGNDILIYDSADQKIDGGAGTDVLRTDEAALGLLNNVGVETNAATGFSVVEVVPFKQNIKNIEVLLITDDAQSNPTKGGLLNLTAQDVLDMTDPNNHTLTVLGNAGDVVNLGIGASAWNKAAPDANGFQTYSQTFSGVELMLKVEHTVVVT